jgi:hypothetical protein
LVGESAAHEAPELCEKERLISTVPLCRDTRSIGIDAPEANRFGSEIAAPMAQVGLVRQHQDRLLNLLFDPTRRIDVVARDVFPNFQQIASGRW